MQGNYKKWINRINSKQDTLTEDNVGQFMDSELPTKLTPTSGDTVLGRDSLTGKAVEIPTSSLGGSGGGLALKVTTPSSYVTGTTSETEVLRIEIPANSLSENDILTISTIMIDKLGTTGNLNIFGKLSTSPTMPSGATDQIFRYTVTSANQFGEIYKDFIINGGKIKGFPFTVSNASSIGTVNPSLFSSKPIDVTVTNYLYISLQGNASDQFRLLGLKISNQ